MKAHAPFRNSTLYKVLGVYGERITTTIDFMLPNLRYELVTCGPYWFSSCATVTPITEQECRIDFCAAWNVFRWVPLATTLFRLIARHFLNQDKRIMERQALGRSEEHTSELQSQSNLVCRLLLEKKKKQQYHIIKNNSLQLLTQHAGILNTLYMPLRESDAT